MSIPSPCSGVCRLDPQNGLCIGCLRSRDEIAVWRDADDATRQRILAALETRRASLPRPEVCAR